MNVWMTPGERRRAAFSSIAQVVEQAEPEYARHDPHSPAVRDSLHFVTTLTNDFAPGLECLLKSLNERAGVPFRFTVVHLDEISREHRARIDDLARIEWMPIRELGEPPRLRTRNPRLAPNYCKLLVWFLPIDADMFFIDSDVLCVDRLDQLLAWRPLTVVRNFARHEARRRKEASYRVETRPIWNSGVFCFRPDREIAREILDLARTYKVTHLGDQEILNDYWNGRRPDNVTYADYAFNYRMYLGVRTHVRLLHFAHPEKPWRDEPRHAYQQAAFRLWRDTWAGRADVAAFQAAVDAHTVR